MKNKSFSAPRGSIALATAASKHEELSNAVRRFLDESPMLPIDSSPLQKWTVQFFLAAVALTLLALYISLHESQVDKMLSPSPALQIKSINGLDYVRVPAGSFMMGCSMDDDHCDPNEKAAHEVKIAKPFWIGRTAVTNDAFARFMKAHKLTAKSFNQNPDYPVTMVDWGSAKQYCDSSGLRLPTEAEWEYAARAGTTALRYGPLGEIAQRQSDVPQIDWNPYPVRQKQPNAWGLFDVLGNVREWVADVSPPNQRVVRGGGRRISERSGLEPLRADHVVGFRCAGDLR